MHHDTLESACRFGEVVGTLAVCERRWNTSRELNIDLPPMYESVAHMANRIDSSTAASSGGGGYARSYVGGGAGAAAAWKHEPMRRL